MLPSKSIQTPARRRTAFGDIKNTPAPAMGKHSSSVLKPSAFQPKPRLKKEQGVVTKNPVASGKTSVAAGLPELEEFPEIEQMFPAEEESEAMQQQLYSDYFVYIDRASCVPEANLLRRTSG